MFGVVHSSDSFSSPLELANRSRHSELKMTREPRMESFAVEREWRFRASVECVPLVGRTARRILKERRGSRAADESV